MAADDRTGTDSSLRESSAKGILDGVLGVLPGVVYRCRNDADWTMLGITDNVRDLTGYDPDELIGNAEFSYGDLIHAEDRTKVWTAVQAGVADGRAFRVVYRIVDRRGRERWVLEQGRALENGQLAGYIQDLSGPLGDRLLRQQDELDRARRQARHLELLQEVTSIVNEAATLEDALGASLPAICRGLGFVVAHVLLPSGGDGGLEPSDLWCLSHDTPALRRSLELARARFDATTRGLPRRVQESGKAEWVWDIRSDPDFGGLAGCDECALVSGVGVPIRSGERRLAVLEFYTDRPMEPDGELEVLLDQVGTQLGRAWEREQALRDRQAGEERFRQLAEHIDDVFWIGTPDDHAREYVSPAYRHVWGRDPGMLPEAPRSWLDAVHPDDRERVEDVVRRRADRGYEIQYRIVRPDGGLRWIWDRAFPVDGVDGEVTRVVGVAEDVTERTKLEAQLRAAHRMEAVGRLAGGIAHDFNNLLTVIRAQSDFLLMDLPEESPLVEEVEVVRSAADRAAELTRQLLAFSREQVLRPRVVDLTEVVRNMGQLLARVLGEDVRIETAFEPGLASVRVDPTQLEQVIMNLAVNARDAMPEGGVLSLRAHREVLTAEVAAGRTELVVGAEYVRFDVADTGHGMDEAVRARIFEPFFTTKRSRGGTGLGLAMAYGIVKQSGGTIHVKSAPGRGTTFVLRFPPVETEPESEATDAPLPGRAPGEVAGTILVVEDDPAVRRVARRALVREGLEVRVAADAENGLEILQSGPEDVAFLLTDLVLPGISGRELLDEVRARYPHVRCIAMSGYAEGSPGSRVDLPADVVFLQKPFTPEGLLRALDAVAD